MNMYPKTHAEAILPPPPRTKMGRPQIKRRREEGERQDPSRLRRVYPLIKCSKCGQTGHNRRGCRVTTSDPNVASTSTAPASASNTRRGRGGGPRRGRGGGPRRGAAPRRGGVQTRRGTNITNETIGAATSSSRVASLLQTTQESVCTGVGQN
ncbi:uncharacterized protein LOC119989978 [Tripterygium wilfordii]|uniref:uncharacterized protein LOC119989978 n=1 Tax=Tripterygium wilfordii TaxID=458696 RepID=UPI0018F80722|nr:uncharacterized protein LOC119989978 [Tripterygium wilfordii]